MASLKEIRTRITSVKSTRQITGAMKMVSAAKLRKAQDAILQIRPYAEKLSEILTDISSGVSISEDNKYAIQRKPKHVMLVAITSNRGLCGSFNVNVVKQAIDLAENEYAELYKEGRVKFVTIGKKAVDILKGRGYYIYADYSRLFDKLNFNNIVPVADTIMQAFVDEKFDRVELIYNQFKNAAVQVLQREQFLPIKVQSDAQSFKSDYIFEPDKRFIIDVLIPKSLKIQFYKSLLDSNAAEHGARMTAMHQATENATELIKDLTTNYNKVRQASITNEILEIVAGAEALKS